MPVSELQGAVKSPEAEIERTKAAECLLTLKEKVAGHEDSEAATDQRRAVSPARSLKVTRDAAASDAAPAVAAERHISSLGDDLLLEIFLRLPSLATLVRAAYTCRTWRRAVASSPAFRRRFRALHPPPLLGLFFNSPNVSSFPIFVPARPRDRDMVAAVRGGKFFRTSLQDGPGEAPCWEIRGCGGGNVLLLNLDDKLLALLNPLTRQRERVLDPFPKGVYHDFDLDDIGMSMFCPDEDPMSFIVAFLAHDDSRIRATVFRSDTRVWSVTPWVHFSAIPDGDNSFCEDGFFHYIHEGNRFLISLDTATMEFSMAKLLQCLIHNFEIGETKDGAACIVYSDGSNIGVLLHTRDDYGVERWVEDRVIPMATELKRVLSGQFDEGIELHVLEVRDGYAYLTTSAMNTTEEHCSFLSLCLETMKLEKLFRRKFNRDAFLYFMSWPCSLLGNCKMFALEDTARPSGTCEKQASRI